MGMNLAFNSSLANFSYMVDLEALNDNVYISEVYHSTFIEVDEKGTEAAAATAIEMNVKMAVINPLILEFNRPFFFFIEEKETNTILFAGQLINFNE
jgi:serine protease inhibitor